MKSGHLKRLAASMLSILLLMSSTSVALADTQTKSYLKTYGGDVMTGGWFKDGTNCATAPTSNYQDPSFSNATITADNRAGGILTYANSSGNVATGGASSQYGAFSLGEVDGRRAGDGFYSQGAQSGGSTSVKALTFANSDPAYAFGGLFDGGIRQGTCIPDYYSKKPATTSPISSLCDALGASGNYSATAPPGGTFNLTPGACASGCAGGTCTIAPDRRITIYVSGNVYIDQNIVYNAGSTVNHVPKFALIVKGSLYIDKDSHLLNGMYVAEPSDTTPAVVASDNGVIWTCHPNSTAQLDYHYPPVCDTPLVVDGSLIAKQIQFLRPHGDITSANNGEDALGTVGNCRSGGCNISEVANYSPAMIMGGSFFESTSGGSSNGLPIDSIVSLPPVF
jgi:hypothetical protein